MITEIINAAFDPKSKDFYQALMVLFTMISGVYIIGKHFIELVIGEGICKSTKLVIKSGIGQYLYWVQAISKSQKVNADTLREWLIQNEGFAFVGEDYKLFKKFIKYLGEKDISKIKVDKVSFDLWLSEYRGQIKWNRVEW